jgi:GAF domain-containing protein
MDLSHASTATLEQVLITGQLPARPSHSVSDATLNEALQSLNKLMAELPGEVLDHLAEAALTLCNAHTVGISILENENGKDVFRWRAMAGQLSSALGGSMARNDSPCGMVLDQRDSLLFTYPERHFPFPGPVNPPIVDVLLTPFFDHGEPVGTIWVVAHDDRRKFDVEDLRVIKLLARFASSAYTVLTTLGYVQGRSRSMLELSGD